MHLIVRAFMTAMFGLAATEVSKRLLTKWLNRGRKEYLFSLVTADNRIYRDDLNDLVGHVVKAINDGIDFKVTAAYEGVTTMLMEGPIHGQDNRDRTTTEERRRQPTLSTVSSTRDAEGPLRCPRRA